MTTIYIEKFDESFMRLWSDDDGAERELSEFFCFEVPGARWSPKYKAGFWDGKVRLYDQVRKKLYLGLLPYVMTFAEQNNYEVSITNQFDKPVHTEKEVGLFLDGLDIHTNGKKIEYRDYQMDAIIHAINNERCVLLSPTSSGKSAMIYGLMRWHVDQNRKVLMIVPSTSLVEQLYSDFADYSSENGWDVDENCQKIYSGFTKEIHKEVTITTWQSIFEQPPSYFKNFDVVFGDEAHHFKSASLTKIFDKLGNTKFRIGTTGTIDDRESKTNKLTLEGMFGKVYKVISTKQLMDQGSVVKLKIQNVVLNYDEDTRKLLKGSDYKGEMDFIVGHQKRNEFIAKLAVKSKGTTLVLFQFVEKHGKPLLKLIKQMAGDRKVYYIAGSVSTLEREEIRQMLKGDEDSIIVASFQTMSTGVNMPAIRNVIFTYPSKSKIRNLQSIGRGLRLADGKSHCTLYDVVDNLKWKSKPNHALKHASERYKIYMEEGFEVNVVEVKI